MTPERKRDLETYFSWVAAEANVHDIVFLRGESDEGPVEFLYHEPLHQERGTLKARVNGELRDSEVAYKLADDFWRKKAA